MNTKGTIHKEIKNRNQIEKNKKDMKKVYKSIGEIVGGIGLIIAGGIIIHKNK